MQAEAHPEGLAGIEESSDFLTNARLTYSNVFR